ncbi:DUF5810 domain-containing protein [Halobaculum sp. CBA1158]|uniref:DUF5810 domain-containing protein n=1 Tax=Halobaculum sp. CBA1158 TaxID=2904243 RepID=UPI001F274788|nr:DUF5810 domain-containing protein [Halobaculum sp. CBA1158]UIO99665.1 DUF5810 domain-containing protein [Halobaculum sp. CBA1158]
MGYACPVCETPQRDGEHLANHLAFTAMLHGDDHEEWLDEHVDGWGDRTPADLASVVTDHASETEYDEVFEDTTGAAGGSPRGEHDGHGDPGRPDAADDAMGDAVGGAAEAVVDEAVESVLAEAQELTEEMYGMDDSNDEHEGEDTAGDDGTADDEATAGGDGTTDDEDTEESDATAGEADER